MLLAIIFFAILALLTAKAILETIWGIVLILYGLVMQTIGYFFHGLAWVVGCFEKLGKRRK